MKRILSVICLVTMMLSFGSCDLFRPAGDAPETVVPEESTVLETEASANSGATEATETEVTTEPDPTTAPTKVSFIGCGDNIIYAGNTREALTKAPEGREYGFAYSYEHVAEPIAAADVSFINQETLMCGEEFGISYYPCFNSPRDLGYDLVDLGFDVINIANNHMLDKSGSGLESTIEFWREQPVLMIGGYDSFEDYNTPRYLESGGMKIAFLSYTYGTNGITVGNDYNVWVPYFYTHPHTSDLTIDAETIKNQIAAAKADSDILIVSIHWGNEYVFTPTDSQRECAKLFADNGVDVIIGHHPHVLQPVEWIEGEDGNRTLCVYSLGNFMAEQADDFNLVGGMISFDMVRGKSGRTTVENVLFIPTVFHYDSGFYNNQVWLMEDYTDDMVAAHGISNYGNYTTLDRLKQYVTDTIPEEFLPAYLK